jgi:hypothetical protein
MLGTYSRGLISIDTSVGCVVEPSVNLSTTDFSFQNLIFKNLFEFSKIQRSQDQAHALLIQSFPRHQEHDLKHPSSVDLITTKQNKLHSFMDSFL